MISLQALSAPLRPSDISPIWNPEAFFNTYTVNGNTWPLLDVEPERYRFRLLNACDSRFLNLSLQIVACPDPALVGTEIPFYQIGTSQSLLPNVVRIQTGEAVTLPGDGTEPPANPNPLDPTALLMGPAERPDVIVHSSSLPDGTVVRMLNTAPDAPFGGFPDVPADPGTTGQVMQFVVMADDPATVDVSTPPASLQFWGTLAPAAVPPELQPLGPSSVRRELALLEEESLAVCVRITPSGQIRYLDKVLPGPTFLADCAAAKDVPFAPKAAALGNILAGVGVVQLWDDDINQNPALNSVETWDLWNRSADAHPIHIHLVKFQVLDRQPFGAVARPPEPWEAGCKTCSQRTERTER